MHVAYPFFVILERVTFQMIASSTNLHVGSLWEWCEWYPWRRDGSGQDHPVHSSHSPHDRDGGQGAVPSGCTSLHCAKLGRWVQEIHTNCKCVFYVYSCNVESTLLVTYMHLWIHLLWIEKFNLKERVASLIGTRTFQSEDITGVVSMNQLRLVVFVLVVKCWETLGSDSLLILVLVAMAQKQLFNTSPKDEPSYCIGLRENPRTVHGRGLAHKVTQIFMIMVVKQNLSLWSGVWFGYKTCFP